MYDQLIMHRTETYLDEYSKYIYEDIEKFTDKVTSEINKLGDRFISVHYPSTKIAIIVYKKEEIDRMFIPWVDDNISIETKIKIKDMYLSESTCTNEDTLKLIKDDERIKELLNTNSFHVAAHPYLDVTISDYFTIDITNAIGNITKILDLGVEVAFNNREYTKNIFKHINKSSLVAQPVCVEDARTGKIRLIKINLGIIKDNKFMVI